MDQPQRANAAQMAARTIKAARPSSRQRPRVGGTPPISNAPMPLELSGQAAPTASTGLFGGSVQASGAFNFAAPATISLPPPTFGKRVEASSDQEDREGHWPGDDRGGKRPSFNGSTTATQQRGSGFQATQPFGQTQQPNPFAPISQGGSLFNFGQQPGSTGINFNAPVPTQSATQPTPNLFSFGQTTQQAQPTSPSVSFESTTSNGAAGNNLFGFNSQPAAPASSSFTFGTSTPQAHPAPTSFSFGKTSGQPSSPGINFGSIPATVAPTSNLFGASQPSNSTQPLNLFGSSTTAPTTTSSSLFSNLNATASPASNLFGSKTQSSAPTNNIFGGLQQPPQPATNNLFGSSQAPATPFVSQSSQAPATSNIFQTTEPPAAPSLFQKSQSQSTPNIFQPSQASANTDFFGEKKPEPAPTNNLFGSVNGQAPPASPVPAKISLPGESKAQPTPSSSTSSFFNNQNQQFMQAGNLFGNPTKPTASTSEPFGNLNKPVDSSVMQSKVNSDAVKAHEASTNFNMFGQPKPSVSSSLPFSLLDAFNSTSNIMYMRTPFSSFILTSTQISSSGNGNSSFSFQSAQQAQPSPSNIFSSMKPVDAPTIANQPLPNGMFPSLPQAGQSSQNSNSFNKSDAPSTSNTFGSKKPLKSSALSSLVIKATLDLTDEMLEKEAPDGYSAADKQKFYAAYRMRSLHQGIGHAFLALDPNSDGTILFELYKEERRLVLEKMISMLDKFDLKAGGVNHTTKPTPANPPKVIGSFTPAKPHNERRIDKDEEKENLKRRTSHFEQLQTSQGLTNGNGLTNGHPVESPVKTLTQGSLFGRVGSSVTIEKTAAPLAPPAPSPTKGKRKAEEQITKNDGPELSSLKRHMKSKDSSLGSSTSNMFKSILDSPDKTSSVIASPAKKVAALPELLKEEKSHPNPFGGLFVPQSPAAPAQPSFAQKTAPVTASTSTKSSLFAPNGPFTPAPAKTNPFALSAVPATAPAATQPNLFAPKTASTPSATQANLFMPKAMPSNTNPFKPTVPAGSAAAPANGVKPPSFSTGPVNFLAQFGQAAAKSAEEEEKKLMKKAQDEEYDSDDSDAEPLEEWQAKWKTKRQADLKALDEAAKSKQASFVPGKGFSFGSTSSDAAAAKKTTEAVSTPSLFEPKPMFGGQAASQGSTSSVFSSLNNSRTSTPGLFGSNNGSVLDGHTPGKPMTSGGSNIFGHLSGVNSKKGNDTQDEDSGDEDENDADAENKDPTYEPSQDVRTSGSPGTPVEETGAGIASTKKTNLFSFGTPASSGAQTPSGTNSQGGGLFGRLNSKEPSPEKKEGSGGLFGHLNPPPEKKESSSTSTPRGGLFDRINRDENGNPIRHISSEEKENTQPSTSNIFSSFNSSINKPSPPSDHTWKPDSPIRFGAPASTDVKISAPAVSITPATPTKHSGTSSLFSNKPATSAPAPAFSNLFGNNSVGKPVPATSSTPFSSLFGTSGTTAPAAANVGFGFGASTGSSSLFPSAAGSATTSRATSPGGTTDGESGADGDPDAEKHEQIDLTAGGPGEEDELVSHEVRAKALKFESEQWITKGLGPLRILKHKETGVSRILMRADPSGKVILNKGILAKVNYESTGKTVKLLTAGDSGGIETWIIQVKTPELATKLAAVLELNKPSA